LSPANDRMTMPQTFTRRLVAARRETPFGVCESTRAGLTLCRLQQSAPRGTSACPDVVGRSRERREGRSQRTSATDALARNAFVGSAARPRASAQGHLLAGNAHRGRCAPRPAVAQEFGMSAVTFTSTSFFSKPASSAETRISLPASGYPRQMRTPHAGRACDLAGERLGEFETVRRKICSDLQKEAERPPIHRA
jgi:hypothetical protein